MNNIMAEVVKAQREKTPFSERYIEFLKAGLGKAITESVVFNIVQWQWKKGELRTDRQHFRYHGQELSKGAFDGNEAAIMANKSDDKILAGMVAFKEANSLDMSETGESWYTYITTGDRPE